MKTAILIVSSLAFASAAPAATVFDSYATATSFNGTMSFGGKAWDRFQLGGIGISGGAATWDTGTAIMSWDRGFGLGLDGVDLTSFDTMTISGLGSTAAGGTVSVWFNFFDAELAPITGAFQVANLATGPIGSVSFDLRSLQFEETSVVNNLSNINSISIYFTGSDLGEGTYAPISYSMSEISFSTIPAPGAIALLGAAGLVGGRLRRA